MHAALRAVSSTGRPASPGFREWGGGVFFYQMVVFMFVSLYFVELAHGLFGGNLADVFFKKKIKKIRVRRMWVLAILCVVPLV